MKKSLIAASASAVALAAMPVFGAFAAITDSVTVQLDSACSVGSSSSTSGAGATLSRDITNGGTVTFAAGTDGGTIKVSCNDASGWHITAVGSGDDATDKTAMNATGSATDIPTVDTMSDASGWQFQVTGTNTVAAYNSFSRIPSDATKVAGAAAAVSEGTINTGYKVHASATQQAGSYTGKVTYTVDTGTGD